MYISKNFALRSVLIIGAVAVTNAFCAAEIRSAESGNNAVCLKAVQTIGEMAGVCDAAILCRDKTVLASVLLDTADADTEALERMTEDFLKRTFKKSKKIRVAINDGTAVDILELAYCSNNNVPRRILNKRFSFLSQQ